MQNETGTVCFSSSAKGLAAQSIAEPGGSIELKWNLGAPLCELKL